MTPARPTPAPSGHPHARPPGGLPTMSPPYDGHGRRVRPAATFRRVPPRPAVAGVVTNPWRPSWSRDSERACRRARARRPARSRALQPGEGPGPPAIHTASADAPTASKSHRLPTPASPDPPAMPSPPVGAHRSAHLPSHPPEADHETARPVPQVPTWWPTSPDQPPGRTPSPPPYPKGGPTRTALRPCQRRAPPGWARTPVPRAPPPPPRPAPHVRGPGVGHPPPLVTDRSRTPCHCAPPPYRQLPPDPRQLVVPRLGRGRR